MTTISALDAFNAVAAVSFTGGLTREEAQLPDISGATSALGVWLVREVPVSHKQGARRPGVTTASTADRTQCGIRCQSVPLERSRTVLYLRSRQ